MALQSALNDCLIDFDRCVLVTNLVEEYKLNYKDVNETLLAHIKQQERNANTKYMKRFLVHGTNPDGGEVFTLVQGETKLKEWLTKLEDAESLLYSVEVDGGAKSPPSEFKPMQHIEIKLEQLQQRVKTTTTTNIAQPSDKVQVAKAEPQPKQKETKSNIEEDKPQMKKQSNIEADKQQMKKQSPTEQKKTNKQGNINSFFGTGTAAKTSTSLASKEPKANTKSTAPTVQSLFKKQAASKSPAPPASDGVKKVPVKESSTAANQSVQLFDDESSASSDEEEKLDKLRREVIASDDEANEKPSVSKRRRIIDSDDEEQPQKKAPESQQQQQQQQNKEDDDDDQGDVEEEQPKTETYLDEDGFVLTVKPKRQSQPAKKRTAPTPAKKKSPPANPKPTGGKTNSTPAAKTKQGNIMSFFTKK